MAAPKIFDKFNKIRTRESSPIRRTEVPITSSSPVSTPRKVRSHTNPNAKLIPIKKNLGLIPTLDSFSDSSNEGKRHMNDVAIEVKMDNQNVHPMDEPLVLRNGKEIYPSINSSVDNKEKSDLMVILAGLLEAFTGIVIRFWNSDLHFKITISEGKPLKVHIPSLVYSLIGFKLIHTLFFKDSNQSVRITQTPTNYGGFKAPFVIIMVIVIAGWFFSQNLSREQSRSTKIPHKSATSAMSNSSNNSTDIEDEITLVDSLGSKKFSENELWDNKTPDITPPTSRKNSFETKLDTLLAREKMKIDKFSTPVQCRREARHKTTKTLNLNLPTNYKKRKSNEFDEMTIQAREQLLKAFY